MSIFEDDKDLEEEIPSSTMSHIADQLDDLNELNENELLLVDVGISPEWAQTLLKGWNVRVSREDYKGTKSVFHPNNSTLKNITKGFWEFVMDNLYAVDLPKILVDKLSDTNKELTLKQIEIKADSIKEASNGTNLEELEAMSKQCDELYKKIQSLQEERDHAKGLAKNMYKIMNKLMVFKDKKPNQTQLNVIKEVKEL